jgi:hypothetical protein
MLVSPAIVWVLKNINSRLRKPCGEKKICGKFMIVHFSKTLKVYIKSAANLMI